MKDDFRMSLALVPKEVCKKRIEEMDKALAYLRISLAPELNFGNPKEMDQAAGAYFLIEKLEAYVEELRVRYEKNP